MDYHATNGTTYAAFVTHGTDASTGAVSLYVLGDLDGTGALFTVRLNVPPGTEPGQYEVRG